MNESPVNEIEDSKAVKAASDLLSHVTTSLRDAEHDVIRLLEADGDPRRLAPKLAEARALVDILTARVERAKETHRYARAIAAKEIAERMTADAAKLEDEAAELEKTFGRAIYQSRVPSPRAEFEAKEKRQNAFTLRSVAKDLTSRFA